MSADEFDKDPGATEDFAVNWGRANDPWLQPGETITTSSWDVPPGLTEGSNSHTDTTATVWLSGGTVDRCYRVSNTITTSQSRTDVRSISVTIVNR